MYRLAKIFGIVLLTATLASAQAPPPCAGMGPNPVQVMPQVPTNNAAMVAQQRQALAQQFQQQMQAQQQQLQQTVQQHQQQMLQLQQNFQQQMQAIR
jgi:hypothetical protein